MFAQGNAGRILGTITDQTGGALPGAMYPSSTYNAASHEP